MEKPREFGDDPRDAEHFARFRLLFEDIVNSVRRSQGGEKFDVLPLFRRFDSPSHFVQKHPDATKREVWIRNLEQRRDERDRAIQAGIEEGLEDMRGILGDDHPFFWEQTDG